jgi:folate-dependent phosphoribosylglycinamide formyltransferase PurN
MLEPIHDPEKGRMRIGGLVSGSGKSLISIIEQQMEMEANGGSPFEVVAIFTENPKSKAFQIGETYNIPVFSNDIRKYYSSRNKKITDLAVRQDFDREIVRLLEPFRPDILAYAGYVWATTEPLLDAFLGVNAHPADLSIEREGKRVFAGAQGVRDALLAGETEVRTSLHLVSLVIDHGPILIISEPVEVLKEDERSLEERSRHYLRILNEKTRALFPRVMRDIAEGTYKRDENGLLYYGETPIPQGLRL